MIITRLSRGNFSIVHRFKSANARVARTPKEQRARAKEKLGI
jgi:hypothetical protein